MRRHMERFCRLRTIQKTVTHSFVLDGLDWPQLGCTSGKVRVQGVHTIAVSKDSVTKGGNTGLLVWRPRMPWQNNAEPTLEQLLRDPAVCALMARDHVDADMLRRLLAEIKHSV